MKINYRFVLTIFVLVFIVFLVFVIEKTPRQIPESVLVFFGDKNENALINASCKADIITSEEVIEDKPLNEVANIFKKVPGIELGVKDKSGKGFYELQTGINSSKNFVGFEIKIVCVSKDNKNVGYTIINSTNMPCELINKGEVLVC